MNKKIFTFVQLFAFLFLLSETYYFQSGYGGGGNSPTGAATNAVARQENMSLIKGGVFKMGRINKDNDERPIHDVTLENYYMDRVEVTYAEFKDFIDSEKYVTEAEIEGWSWVWQGDKLIRMKNINWRHDSKGNLINQTGFNHPVLHVSWFDAIVFCNWRSEVFNKKKYYSIDMENKVVIGTNKTATGYRLPTEAEWEYAARGGHISQNFYFCGSNDVGEVAWHRFNSDNSTHPVATRIANELGIYDMSGNVWEWCFDWYDQNYYATKQQSNPIGPDKGKFKVLRGGSWHSITERTCEYTLRYWDYPKSRSNKIGFRCAKNYDY
jgi:formylglycine-generating enzyme required for sulfatase activity